jgi:hypothetical protein
MSAFHLLKELRDHFKVKTNAALAIKLNAQEATLSRLQSHPPRELPTTFLIRCYDASGFSIERIRELYKQK